jgi:hypothetical protein
MRQCRLQTDVRRLLEGVCDGEGMSACGDIGLLQFVDAPTQLDDATALHPAVQLPSDMCRLTVARQNLSRSE